MTAQPDSPQPLRVLMLGWEFPPFITGGLGTACYGLTRAMNRRGLKVTFVLPKATDSSEAEHVHLLSPEPGPDGEPVRYEPPDCVEDDPEAGAAIPQSKSDSSNAALSSARRTPGKPSKTPSSTPADASSTTEDDHSGSVEHGEHGGIDYVRVPAGFRNPYQREAGDRPVGQPFIAPPGRAAAPFSRGAAEQHSANELKGADEDTAREYGAASSSTHTPDPAADHARAEPEDSMADDTAHNTPAASAGSGANDYDGDLFDVVEQYARFCAAEARNLDFDIIHAHDWMTYAAGLRIARVTGKPLVVHIHSTEFDRAGEHINRHIYDIERRGTHGAIRVIAVSQLTKNIMINRYGLRDHQVEVVYNGVDLEPRDVGMTGIRSKDRIVLYFGRITHQKGPEYFIRAAKRVLDVMDDVKFVVAGSGDMAKRMIEMAAELGIGHKVLFTGFLRGKDIQRIFAMADLYVMPSVSEPFGIAPLEAMSNDVPALISRTSGVSEILRHALKVDFWDVDDIANKVVAVLKYPPLQRALREHGAFEVRGLTWDGAAERCEQIYRDVLREMHELTGPATPPTLTTTTKGGPRS